MIKLVKLKMMLKELRCLLLVSLAVGFIVNIKLMLIISLWEWVSSIVREKTFLLFVFPPSGALIAGLLLWSESFKELKGWGPGLDLTLEEIKRGERPKRPLKALLLKALAQVIGVGLGNSGGLVGPSGRIGYLLAHFIFKEGGEELSLIALAAAIGSSLKAPIGGGILVFELFYGKLLLNLKGRIKLLFYMEMASALGALTSLINLKSLGPFDMGDIPLSVKTLFLLPLVGALGGLTSFLFVRYYEAIRDLSGKVKENLRPFLMLLVSLSFVKLSLALSPNLNLPNILGHGLDNLVALKGLNLQGEIEIRLSLLLILGALGKILANGSYVGSGGSGGMIGPSLVTGGLMGGGVFLALYHYGLVTMEERSLFIALTSISTLAGAVGSPLGCAILSYELYGIKSFFIALVPALMANIITCSYLKR